MTPSQNLLLTLAVSLSLLCGSGAVLAGLGTRLGWWEFGIGFAILRWSVYLLALPIMLAVVSALSAGTGGGRLRDIRYALVLVTSLAVFGLPSVYLLEFRRHPTLADATTNFTDPPVFVALVTTRAQTARNPLEYRGGDAAALQRSYFADLATLRTRRTPMEVVATAASAARTLGWTIVAEEPAEGRLEATVTTFWFGFNDDVVLRARRAVDGQTEIDIRSASRVGLRDGGANAKRLRKLLDRLKDDV